MKLSFSLQKKEANFEADVEGIVEKSLEHKSKNSNGKTRYQIKQEEKRKTEELKQKQKMQYIYLMLALIVLFALIGIIGSIFGI